MRVDEVEKQNLNELLESIDRVRLDEKYGLETAMKIMSKIFSILGTPIEFALSLPTKKVNFGHGTAVVYGGFGYGEIKTFLRSFEHATPLDKIGILINRISMVISNTLGKGGGWMELDEFDANVKAVKELFKERKEWLASYKTWQKENNKYDFPPTTLAALVEWGKESGIRKDILAGLPYFENQKDKAPMLVGDVYRDDKMYAISKSLRGWQIHTLFFADCYASWAALAKGVGENVYRTIENRANDQRGKDQGGMGDGLGGRGGMGAADTISQSKAGYLGDSLDRRVKKKDLVSLNEVAGIDDIVVASIAAVFTKALVPLFASEFVQVLSGFISAKFFLDGVADQLNHVKVSLKKRVAGLVAYNSGQLATVLVRNMVEYAKKHKKKTLNEKEIEAVIAHTIANVGIINKDVAAKIAQSRKGGASGDANESVVKETKKKRVRTYPPNKAPNGQPDWLFNPENNEWYDAGIQFVKDLHLAEFDNGEHYKKATEGMGDFEGYFVYDHVLLFRGKNAIAAAQACMSYMRKTKNPEPMTENEKWTIGNVWPKEIDVPYEGENYILSYGGNVSEAVITGSELGLHIVDDEEYELGEFMLKDDAMGYAYQRLEDTGYHHGIVKVGQDSEGNDRFDVVDVENGRYEGILYDTTDDTPPPIEGWSTDEHGKWEYVYDG